MKFIASFIVLSMIILEVQPVPASKGSDITVNKEKALQFISVNKRGIFKDLYNECCVECCQAEEIQEAGIFNKTRVQFVKENC
ncbi:uncharacterized protein LOC110241279 isoform X2 [Exaiptasia diaphana]|uniref:Uncharacterized protein n=1 Tax=Exaiptasia diaphana TaxID=2652724 RepID=A0A913YM45_EXADI|nr:uncharacterized protein LOC110241279 isoform X2 [Exaiptasia diaphana]